MTQRKKQSREAGEPGAAIPELEAEIDQTREEISDELRTLGDKLSPENLKREAKEVMQEAKTVATETLHEAKDVATSTFRDVRDTAMETVHEKVSDMREGVRRAERQTVSFLRENAVPLAMIGIGAAWLFSRSRDGASARARDRYARGRTDYWLEQEAGGTRGRPLGERTRELAQRAQHRVGEVTDRARDFSEQEIDHVRNAARGASHRVGEAMDQARDFTGRELREARDYSRRISSENPLAVGMAALAAGVGVGLLLPATQRERELLGEKRGELVGEAKNVLDGLTQTARDAAREMKGSLSGSAE